MKCFLDPKGEGLGAGRTIITIFRFRPFFPYCLYILISRGNNGEKIFLKSSDQLVAHKGDKDVSSCRSSRAISGRPLLHAIPGRYEAIESVWHQVRTEAVRAVVCSAEKDEIH